LGVKTLATIADEEGTVLGVVEGVKALQHAQKQLRAANKAYSRTKRGSNGRRKAAARLGKMHARVKAVVRRASRTGWNWYWSTASHHRGCDETQPAPRPGGLSGRLGRQAADVPTHPARLARRGCARAPWTEPRRLAKSFENTASSATGLLEAACVATVLRRLSRTGRSSRLPGLRRGQRPNKQIRKDWVPDEGDRDTLSEAACPDVAAGRAPTAGGCGAHGGRR